MTVIFRDLHGNEHQRPADAPLEWRISCYTVVIRDGQLLMTEPIWSPKRELPGGRVDIHTEEPIIVGATRECLEETGFIFRPREESMQLVTENFFCFPRFHRYYHALAFVVLGEVENDDPISEPDPAEIKRVAWTNLSDITAETTQWMHYDALQKIGVI